MLLHHWLYLKCLGPNSALCTEHVVNSYNELFSRMLDGVFSTLQSRIKFLTYSLSKFPSQRECAFTCEVPFLTSMLCSNCSYLTLSDNASIYFREWKVWGWSSLSGHVTMCCFPFPENIVDNRLRLKMTGPSVIETFILPFFLSKGE